MCRYAVGEGEFAVGARLYGEVGQDVRVPILGGEGHDTGAEIARMDFGQSTESPIWLSTAVRCGHGGRLLELRLDGFQSEFPNGAYSGEVGT